MNIAPDNADDKAYKNSACDDAWEILENEKNTRILSSCVFLAQKAKYLAVAAEIAAGGAVFFGPGFGDDNRAVAELGAV